MELNESKAESIGTILMFVGVLFVFFGINAPLIAGSILYGAVIISRSLRAMK